MTARVQLWRSVRHPLQICVRKGWTWGRGCLVSPRGTVFEVRLLKWDALARKRQEFQLVDR